MDRWKLTRAGVGDHIVCDARAASDSVVLVTVTIRGDGVCDIAQVVLLLLVPSNSFADLCWVVINSKHPRVPGENSFCAVSILFYIYIYI